MDPADIARTIEPDGEPEIRTLRREMARATEFLNMYLDKITSPDANIYYLAHINRKIRELKDAINAAQSKRV